MYCTKCGASIGEGESFCSACGAPCEARTVTTDQGAPLQNGSFYIAPLQEAPKKKRTGALVAIVAVSAMLVLASSLAALFFIYPKQMKNLAAKLFYSDAEYFKSVVRSEINENSSGILDSLYKDKDGTGNFEGDFSIKAIINDSLMASVTGIGGDREWLNGIGLDITNGTDGDVNEGKAILTLSGKKIFSLEYRVDKREKTICLKVPEFSDEYVSLGPYFILNSQSLFQGGTEDYTNTLIAFASLSSTVNASRTISSSIDALVVSYDRKEIEELINKYTAVVLDGISEVTKTKETFEIDGVSEKLSVYSAELSSEDVENIVKTVIERAKADGDLDRFADILVEQTVNGEGSWYIADDPEEIKEQIVSFVDRFIDGSMDYGSGLTFSVFVDGSGNIKGFDLRPGEEYQNASVTFRKVDADGKTAFDFQRVIGSDVTSTNIVSVTGSGDLEDGVFTGDVVMNAVIGGENYEILKLSVDKYDGNSAKAGEYSGKVTVKPCSGISKMLNGGASSYDDALGAKRSVFQLLPLLSFTIEAEYKDGVQNFSASVEAMAQTLFGIEGSFEKKDIEVSESAPATSVYIASVDDLKEWLESIDPRLIIKALEDAGVPSDILGALKESIN